MYAASGLRYNFEKIKLKQQSGSTTYNNNEYNTGYYTKISKKGVFNMSKRNTNIGNSLNIVKDKIRYYRELNNYSYQGLSDKLMLHGIDIHKQEIYKIETGKRTVVDYELCGFAKVFNVKLEDLVSDFIDNI